MKKKSFFENHQLHIIKSLDVYFFRVNMLNQTQYSLISPFCNEQIKTGVHFRFPRETLKVVYVTLVKDFLNFKSRTMKPFRNNNSLNRFNAVPQVIKQREQCKVCMQIACLKLNLLSGCLDVTACNVEEKRKIHLSQNF